MNNIVDPTSGVSYSIFSNEGISLLKQYVSLYQSGGKKKTKGKGKKRKSKKGKKRKSKKGKKRKSKKGRVLKYSTKKMLEAHPNERIKNFVSYYEKVFSDVKGDYKGIMFALNSIENELNDENKLNDKDVKKLIKQIKNHDYYLINSLADPVDGILLHLYKRMDMLLGIGIENEDKLFEFIELKLMYPGIKQFQNTFKLLRILREDSPDYIKTIEFFIKRPELLVETLKDATKEEGLRDMELLQTVEFIVEGVRKLYTEAKQEAEAETERIAKEKEEEQRKAAEAKQAELDNENNIRIAELERREIDRRAGLIAQADLAETPRQQEELLRELNDRPTVLQGENNPLDF
jgi:hypothetical protein